MTDSNRRFSTALAAVVMLIALAALVAALAGCAGGSAGGAGRDTPSRSHYVAPNALLSP